MEEALQYTQIAVNIIIILLFIGLVILVFKLIGTVKNISEKVEKLSGDLNNVKPKVEATIEKINSLSDNVNLLVTKVNNNVDVLTTVVDRIKETADDIIDFEKKIQSKIEPPVMDTLNTITAVSVGVKTFFDKLKEKREKRIVIDKESLDKLDEFEESLEEANKELDEVNAKLTDLQK